MKLSDEGMIVLYDGKGLQIREVTDEVAKLEAELETCRESHQIETALRVEAESSLQQAQAEIERQKELLEDNWKYTQALHHETVKLRRGTKIPELEKELEQSRQREARLQAELGLKNAGQCDCDECVEQALKEE